jgi:hypothetical protein
MTNEFMKDRLAVVWTSRPGVLLRKLGAMVLHAFKRHLAPAIETTFAGFSVNTDLVVIPGKMTSELQVLGIVVKKPLTDNLKQLCGGCWYGAMLWPELEESRGL